MTRCRSSTSKQPGQRQSRQRHSRLWPFRQEITPWLRHLAHFGVRSALRPAPLLLPSTSPSLGIVTSISKWSQKIETLHHFVKPDSDNWDLMIRDKSCSRWNIFSQIDGCEGGFKFKASSAGSRPALVAALLATSFCGRTQNMIPLMNVVQKNCEFYFSISKTIHRLHVLLVYFCFIVYHIIVKCYLI